MKTTVVALTASAAPGAGGGSTTAASKPTPIQTTTQAGTTWTGRAGSGLATALGFGALT